MDRDRERDRDRRDDRYSNMYRPRSPGPRIDSYRSTRSPPRRGPLAADTYTPASRAVRPRSRSPTFRRRSRSPRRDDADRWRARPRSPPRRAYSPRRDDYRSDRGRSPRRDGYDSYTRSPRPRDRSPLPRERELSPARSRGMRSPPRVKRESPPRSSRYEESRSRAHSPYRRPYSPPRDTREYRRHSPSPRRNHGDPYAADTWRRRSLSPVRPAYASNDASGRESAATSRRSSPPPVHPSRAALVTDERSLRDPISAPRSPYRERDDRDRERDYDRDRDYARERERERSPPRHRDTPPTGPRSDREFAPPTGPSSSYRNGDSNFPRAPPTGPAIRSYPSPAISPPVGPSGSTPQPPAYPRGNNPVLAAPTRPRGGGRGGFAYDSPRDFSGPPPRRGSAHWVGRGGGGYYGGPPSGPRGSTGGSAPFAPPFRGSSNSTSTTYPRTQRFRDHLADLPKEVPGGQKAPELYDKSKILKLEEEARKLREVIDAKETQKRRYLREWETLERDSNNAALRADLAEQQLRSLNGEGEVGGAAF
ncbi:hypothetical protein K469DRAFT_728332 [Zopfia rhizophila CBS 207.26]|uniref:Serine/arginine repetitive matrix protein 1 n=1 Tax=Zopfia rhizophila CBS 207.26 TaxID=1314779 RepID=A0A6A6DSW2_9PEZI|nr:hypothetical protein K469DRAFT_728332 [Zopfia rhizophila CBS 207.26]